MKFDIQTAIRDEGVCANQTVPCDECPIGKALGTAERDVMCDKSTVLALSKLIQVFLDDQIQNTKVKDFDRF